MELHGHNLWLSCVINEGNITRKGQSFNFKGKNSGALSTAFMGSPRCRSNKRELRVVLSNSKFPKEIGD